jgi:dolichol-phosphate mannosyltransferase
MTSVCLITPAFNEAENLPVLYERVRSVMEQAGADWQWIIVDDSSEDNTYSVLCELAQKDPRIGAIRLSRNYGSHLAIRCGLRYAKCECAVILAADLQDPPEIIPDLISEWRAGARVVWAERGRSPNESRRYQTGARLYYALMRHLVGIRKLPPSGADVVLLDADVIKAVSQFRETNVSLFILIAWLGFRQSTISYEKGARLYGKSGWTLTGLVKLVIDSITAFSYLPIRAITYFGVIVAIVGFLYAIWIIFAALTGNPPEGWASLMVVVLVLSGFQMLMLGVLGEYLWRALDEARSRPPFILESAAGLLADIVETDPISPKGDGDRASAPADD